MTICNIYRFGYLEERKHSWLEFYANVSAEKQRWPYDRMALVLSDLVEDEYYDVWDNLLYPTSYVSSLDINQAFRRIESRPLIVDCALSGAYGIRCTDITRFTWNPIYQGCYTIRVPENVTAVSLFEF